MGELFLMYALKVSGILLLFYGIYQVFLMRETFYKHNRQFLIAGIFASFVLPLIHIPRYIEVSPLAINTAEITTVSAVEAPVTAFLDLPQILFFIYLMGLVYFLGQFFGQLIHLFSEYAGGKKSKQDGLTYVQLAKGKKPFSFFNTIFFTPNGYTSQELDTILLHEEAHCRQWHSLDVLLGRLVAIFLWFNPISWLYQRSISQNLEFMADEVASSENALKTYQYTLLKVSGVHVAPALTNTFYNSLIKKRIVMLQQSKSQKRNMLKYALILPALAFFMFSFNTKEIYITKPEANQEVQISDGKSIEITIDSKTTNDELKEIKKDLAEKGVDFSYTAVRNEDGEIIDLELHVSSEEEGNSISGSSSFSNDGKPIDPVTMMIDKDKATMLFMGEEHKNKFVHRSEGETIWVTDEGDDHKRIEVIKMGDGDEKEVKIIVNGEEVDEEEYEEMKGDDKVIKKTIKIVKGKGEKEEKKEKKERNVFIIKDSDDDHDIEVIEGDGSGFMFLDMDGNGEEPMYLIDGKKSTKEDVKKLGTKNIATIDVLKGESAEKKYGKDAKHGVVEITTQKKKD
ncbi:MAG: M56 family metallopeptidase [Bacteroidia bacterium]|nr:M56 family metallopeptidase [Bacteroidia bacterium]